MARVLDSAFTAEPCDRLTLETERVRLTAEIDRLTTAIAGGDEIPQLVAALRERDKRLRQIESRLVVREAPDREALRLALMQQIVD